MYNSFQEFVLTYDPKADSVKEMQILIKGQIKTYKVIDLDFATDDVYFNIRCDFDCYFIDFQDNIPFFLFRNQLHSIGMKAGKSYYLLLEKNAKIATAYSQNKKFEMSVLDYDKAHETQIHASSFKNITVPLYYNVIETSSEIKRLIFLFNGKASKIGEDNNFIPYTNELQLQKGETLVSFSDRYLISGSGFLVDDFGNAMYEHLLFKVQELIAKYANSSDVEIYCAAYDSANYIALKIGKDINASNINLVGDLVNPLAAKSNDLLDYNTNATRHYLENTVFNFDFDFKKVLQVTTSEDSSDAQTKIIINNQSMISENIDYIYGERSFLLISDYQLQTINKSLILKYEKRLISGVDFKHVRLFLRLDYEEQTNYHLVYGKTSSDEKHIVIEINKPNVDFSKAKSVAFIMRDNRYNLLSQLSSNNIYDKLEISNVNIQENDKVVTCSFIINNASIRNLPKMKISVNQFIHSPSVYESLGDVVIELNINRNAFKDELYSYTLLAGEYLYNLEQVNFKEGM